MVERGGELGLAQEPLAESLVLGQLGREQLERDLALQARVVRPVDDAHAAPAEQRLDPIAEQLRADPRVYRKRHRALRHEHRARRPRALPGGPARRRPCPPAAHGTHDACPDRAPHREPSVTGEGYFSSRSADVSRGERTLRAALDRVRLSTATGLIRLDANRQAVSSAYLTRIDVDDRGRPLLRPLRVAPDVEQTFNGYFTRSTPAPSRTSPACRRAKPPPWAVGS